MSVTVNHNPTQPLKIVFILLFVALPVEAGEFYSSHFGRLAVLKEYCERDAKTVVYDRVRVDGYYSDNRIFDKDWLDLVDSEFSWIETCPDDDRFHYPRGPGCYRMEKIKRSEGGCDPEVDKSLKFRARGSDLAFFKESCIKTTRSEKPTAEYRYYNNNESIYVAENKKYEIFRQDTWIQRIDGEKLYEQVDYAMRHMNNVASYSDRCFVFGIGMPKEGIPAEDFILYTLRGKHEDSRAMDEFYPGTNSLRKSE